MNIRKLPVREREKFVTKAEVAEFLAISLRTMDREIAAGMPSYKRGNRRRFRLSEVEEWIARQDAA